MKSRFLMLFAALTMLIALAIPVQLSAQENPEHNQKHHHYQLFDLGTFGGPQSFTQDQLQFLTNRGVVAGWADTSTPDPNYPNSCFFCSMFGPYILHAFQWKDGVLTDLGSLPGVNSSAAFFLSDSGLSAGFSENGIIDPLLGIPAIQAVRWRKNQITDLGTLGGGYESVAFGVNNRGQIAGISLNLVPDPFGFGTQQRTFRWQNGVMQDLGTLGGPDAGLLGFIGNIEINEGGQVTACSYTNSTPNPTTGTPTLDPFLWDEKKGMLDLGSLGGTSGCAVNLNNRGEVIGYSDLAGDSSFHPFLWGQKSLKDLGTFGGCCGISISINNTGEVVGWATDQNEQVLAFLWKNGVMTKLGLLSPLPYSDAQWINSRGQVVGFAAPTDFSSHVAFLWENGGPMVDLNTLVPPGSELQLAQALNINDHGEIAGAGILPSGDTHPFLLIPCDENHPGVEGCDYSLVEASTAVPQTSPAVGNASSRTLRQSLLRQTSRYRFPGAPFGPRN